MKEALAERRSWSVFLALTALLGCVAPPDSIGSGGRGKGPRIVDDIPTRGYDVQHYEIELTLDPETRSIDGLCTIRLTPTVQGLDWVDLDLRGLEVSNVRNGHGQDLRFKRDDDELSVELYVPRNPGDVVDVVVRYGGTPETGLWFSGESASGTGPAMAFSQGQPAHNQGWFPCFDHPSDRATSEIKVTLPAGWVAIAAGERVDVSETGGLRTEHWRMDADHPSYLITLVAGELEIQESTWNGIPLTFASSPANRAWLEASFEETDEILAFLSDYTGLDYPYSKYSQVAVENFPSGGMENISASTLTSMTLGDERKHRDRSSTGLVAHEAAHQWFGDLMTCRDWSHIWLNEGLATYMTQLYFEETRGQDEFRARMRDIQNAYLIADRGSARRPTVTTDWEEPEELFDERAYQGAAARLHLLRFMLGDEVFAQGIRTYAAENAGKDVVTEDFQRAMEKVSGEDLDTFFEQWFYGPGYPEFEVRWEYDEVTSRVVIDVWQTHTNKDGTARVFEVPVEIEVMEDAGIAVHRVNLFERKQRFDFPVDSKPLYVRFDKGGFIPKTIKWEKKPAEWLTIAHSDDDVNGRRDAVRALGILAGDLKGRDWEQREAYAAELVYRLEKDPSPWVRAEAALALGQCGGVEPRQRLQWAAREDSEARVRVAALQGLQSYGAGPELAEFATETFDERFSWDTMGAAAGLYAVAAPKNAYAFLTERLFIDSPHDRLRGQLFEHLGALDNEAAADQLRRWANDTSVHPSARGKALQALATQRREITENSRFIAQFLDDESFLLTQAAIEALAKIDDANARQSLEAYYPDAKTNREKQAIEAAFRGRRMRRQ